MTMEKLYINHTSNLVREILRQMHRDCWKPDYIVGITRGGLEPANMISQYLDIPMQALNVSLRDSQMSPESNLWMAEDAYGIHRVDGGETTSNPVLRKKILIVDDINDTGATLEWIKKDWISGCFPNDQSWNEIWQDNVRFAVLVDNASSDFKNVRYSGMAIDKSKDASWIVFPWEEWWIKS